MHYKVDHDEFGTWVEEWFFTDPELKDIEPSAAENEAIIENIMKSYWDSSQD